MRQVILAVCFVLLVACGGGPRPASGPDAASGAASAPVPVGPIDCQVGALSRTEEELTVAFWNDQVAHFGVDEDVLLTTPDGDFIGIGRVHRRNPEQGAMSVRLQVEEMQHHLDPGQSFRLSRP